MSTMSPRNILQMEVDQSTTLQPTKIFYLDHSHSHSREKSPERHTYCAVIDLTSRLSLSSNSHAVPGSNDSASAFTFAPEFHERLRTVLNDNPQAPLPTPTWLLTTASRFKGIGRTSRLTITEHQPSPSPSTVIPPATSTSTTEPKKVVAEFHSSLLSFGATHISFPRDSSHSSHEITVKPLAIQRRAQSFVKDSVTYVWESTTPSSHSKLSLYKAVASKKVEVARYESSSGRFELKGILVLDEREVDALVAVVTLVGVLGQNDAFYCPGFDLIGK